jgi:hypothetical protein
MLFEINFNSPYTVDPRVTITTKNGKSARFPVFVRATSNGFKIYTDTPIDPTTTYECNYIIIASETVATP